MGVLGEKECGIKNRVGREGVLFACLVLWGAAESGLDNSCRSEAGQGYGYFLLTCLKWRERNKKSGTTADGWSGFFTYERFFNRKKILLKGRFNLLRLNFPPLVTELGSRVCPEVHTFLWKLYRFEADIHTLD